MKATPTQTTGKLLLFLFSIFAWSFSHGQNAYPVVSTSVETQCMVNCIGLDSIPYVSDSSLIRVTMTINLFESTGINSIHVKLGTTGSGSSDLLSKTFIFDVFGNVGQGCSFARVDDVVTLCLGDYNGLTTYNSEVKVERVDHSMTDTFTFDR